MKYKRIVPQYVDARDVESRGLCDFCGEGLYGQGKGNADDVEIRARLGDVYDADDYRTTEEFDCCVKCWTEKVRPALEALGGRCWTFDTERGRLGSMPLDPGSSRRAGEVR